MILGHEPIRFLREGRLVLALFTPSLALGQQKPLAPDNSWTSQAAAAPANAPAEPNRSEAGEGAGERAGSDAEQNEDFAEDTAMHWPDDSNWKGDGWDDFDPTGVPAAQTTDEPPARGSRDKAPRYSLWLGAGFGWTLPFGSLWGTCAGVDTYGRCVVVDGVSSHDYVAQGPAAELNLGARLAHNYNLYGLWEHSWLGAGSATSAARGQPAHGDTDFIGLGLRVSTDPDELGFVLDIAVGARRMRAVWSDGTELQMTDAPFETRLGFGADVRMGRHWSLMPMIAFGLGSFGKSQWVYPDHTVQSAMQPEDVALTHGWVGLQMSAHADIFGTR